MDANAAWTIKLPKRQGQGAHGIVPDWLLFAIVSITVSVIVRIMEGGGGGAGSLLRTRLYRNFPVNREITGKFCRYWRNLSFSPQFLPYFQ